MYLLLFLFRKKSPRVSPVVTKEYTFEENTDDNENVTKGKKKRSSIIIIREQWCDADSEMRARACERGSNRRHGVCCNELKEDTKVLRQKHLDKAFSDAGMM